MYALIKKISAIDLVLLVLALLAITYIGLRVLVEWHIVKLGPTWLQVNEVCFQAATAYITSYGFYLLVTILPRYKDQQRLEPYFKKQLDRIISSHDQTIDSMKSSLALQGIECDTFKEVFAKINPQSPAPLILDLTTGNVSWIVYLDFERKRNLEAIQNVVRLSHYIDAELISLLTDIEDCPYFKLISLWNTSLVRNENFSPISKQYLGYSEYINKLKDYMKINFN